MKGTEITTPKMTQQQQVLFSFLADVNLEHMTMKLITHF